MCCNDQARVTVRFPAQVIQNGEVLTGYYNERICLDCDRWFQLEFDFYQYKSEVHH